MAPPCWDMETVIKEELELFVSLRNKHEKASPASSPPDTPFTDVECGRWEDAPNSKCHASFGDQGTTATVGAFGQLIQFSDHLDA
ncbi:hypothetical protein INS49_003913 [Diaporthe citri]|uniref:uncharacterized protein n=1 Tax=Diaporthe citri TaxID=83186 RepID=UPI001C7F7315|nr:uncharacterized protein INS49_003913 [Diaporthe citri]KAG6354832.1 hypothetical protein INS49_003913 [Diaporthe citri]